MAKVRWGGLSTAKISTEKVLPALQQGEHCEVVGVASRSLESAQKAAEPLGIPKTYGSYEAMLADPEIDAVYNPLPNDLHVPWSIKALEAGKHVLCEKPIGMDWQDGQKLVDAAQQYPNLKVMEAFMYRHHPQWQKARELVRDGKLESCERFNHFFLTSMQMRTISAINLKMEEGGYTILDAIPSPTHVLFLKQNPSGFVVWWNTILNSKPIVSLQECWNLRKAARLSPAQPNWRTTNGLIFLELKVVSKLRSLAMHLRTALVKFGFNEEVI